MRRFESLLARQPGDTTIRDFLEKFVLYMQFFSRGASPPEPPKILPKSCRGGCRGDLQSPRSPGKKKNR